MIVAVVIGIGFIVLLIAPTIHRRINENSREQARVAKESRAADLLSSSNGASLSFDNAKSAAQLRDRLLIRGVRAELLSDTGKTLVVFNVSDQERVIAVKNELGID